ncbi:MAG: ATP-binding protein [Oscillospiraceae bacterium]|nr:ATP-binding protein [Oscillospiraceae bacterium]
MNIPEDILKYNLQNVYFLIGAACGGKTTMANAISKKYGYMHFNDNYHEENFANFQKICDERYKESPEYTESASYDWERHFNRPPEEYNKSLGKGYLEYFEYAIIEIIKFANKNVVVADINLLGLSCNLIKQIAPYNRIACLLASPGLVVKDYYERDDHRDIYEAIMRLKDPGKALKNMEDVTKQGTQKTIDEVKKSGLFYIMRDENSSVENTLNILERHFELIK